MTSRTRFIFLLAMIYWFAAPTMLSAQTGSTPPVAPDATRPHALFLPWISNEPNTTTQTSVFHFVVDPVAQTVNLQPLAAMELPRAAITAARPLLADLEVAHSFFAYEFQTGNRMLLRMAYRNQTADLLFLQPFSLSVRQCSTQVTAPCTRNIVTSREPAIRDEDLGGDGILSPSESSAPLTFEIVHKGQPFTYAVDLLAVVEPLPTATNGLAVITGEVYDDASGLPIADAVVTVTDLARSLDPLALRAVTDAEGRYRLVTAAGPVNIQIAAPGYTASRRTIAALADHRVAAFDARLMPLDPQVNSILTVVGGNAVDAANTLQLSLPPFALPLDTELRLTSVGAQSLLGLPPLGWSPVAAVDMQPAGILFSTSVALTVPAPAALPSDRNVVAVRWDDATWRWIVVGAASRSVDNSQLQIDVDRSGHYAFLLPDPTTDPNTLAAAIPGNFAALPPRPTDLTVVTTPADRILLAEAGRRTTVTVQTIAAAEMTSGLPFAVTFGESYAAVDGRNLFPPSHTQDFLLYAFPAGANRLTAVFQATPSRVYDLASLRLGRIDLTLQWNDSPGLPQTGLIDPAGATIVSADGAQWLAPSAATVKLIPAALRRLVAADLAVPAPTGFTFVDGVKIDFHGATLQRTGVLSLPAPSTVAAGDQILVARLIEIAGASRWALVGQAQLVSGRLVTVDDGTLPFFGLRQEGIYAFFKADVPLAFVNGFVVAADGFPLRGGLVTSAALPLVAESNLRGQFVLAAPPGSVTLTVVDPRTDDQLTLTGVTGAPLNGSLAPTPPQVLAVAPADGDVDVPLAATVLVTFTEAVDPASIHEQSLVLTSAGVAVAAVRSLSADYRVVSLRPTALLLPDADYQLDVGAGIYDLNGRGLVNPLRVHFHSVDTTPPPRPPAGALSASIPQNGVSIVRGSVGTVQPDWIVTVINRSANTRTTVQPAADGSFAALVAADPADTLVLELIDASGLATTVALPPFSTADGSIVLGADGGEVVGAGGVQIDVPAGALLPGTTIKAEPLQESDLPASPPPEFGFVGGIKLQLSQDATRSLTLSIPAPADAAPTDLVLVVRRITWPHGSAWEVADVAGLQDGRYTTAAAPAQAMRTHGLSKQLPRPLAWGIGNTLIADSYSFLRTEGDCVSLVQVSPSFLQNVIMSVRGAFGAYRAEADLRAVVFPAVCNQEFAIEVRDPDTDRLIQTLTQTAPGRRNSFKPLVILTDDKTAPVVLRHNIFSGYQLEEIHVQFSKVITESSYENFAVKDDRGQPVTGTLRADSAGSELIFRPEVAFGLDQQFTVELSGLADNAGNRVQVEPFRFKIFKPRPLTNLADVMGRAQGTQAVAQEGTTLFVAHSPTISTTAGAPIQYLSIFDTRVLTDPVMIGQTPTGLVHLRHMVSIPDVFAFSPNGVLSPTLTLRATLSETAMISLTQSLDGYTLTQSLRDLFADADLYLVGQPITLSLRAEIVQKSPGVEWLIHNRDDFLLIKRVDNEQLEIYTGRDLLAVVGTTSATVGNMELLEIYDVTACTRLQSETLPDPAAPTPQCFSPGPMTISRKVLTDPQGRLTPYSQLVPRRANIPNEIGVPLQLAALNDRASDAVAVYVVNDGIGLQAVDVARAPNRPGATPLSGPALAQSDPAPDGLLRGRFLDVSVLKNRLLAAEIAENGHKTRLTVLSLQLTREIDRDGTPVPLPTVDLWGVTGVDGGANFVYDMDADGNFGPAEDTDKNPANPNELDGVKAIDEVFDFALVTGSAFGAGGALWVIDVSMQTGLTENQFVPDAPRVVAAIPLPLGVRSVQADPSARAAYVEVSGEGVYVINLDDLAETLKNSPVIDADAAPELVDRNDDGRDDRIAGVYRLPSLANRGEIGLEELTERPLVYLNQFNEGVELVQICNNCNEFVLDFKQRQNWVDEESEALAEAEAKQARAARGKQAYFDEKRTLVFLLDKVIQEMTASVDGLQARDILIIEQGSGGCFWRAGFEDDPTGICASFNPGSSDHDFEIFVPSRHVRAVQSVADRFVALPRAEDDPIRRELIKLEDFTLYAMPREPFELGVLLSSPPMNKEGDTAGDLGMARQSLLLLWLFTAGDYVPLGARDVSLQGTAVYTSVPNLDTLVDCLRANRKFDQQHGGCADEDATLQAMFPAALYPTLGGTSFLTPTTGIPPLEGYEFVRLQEYNIYKTGAMLRVRGACNFTENGDLDVFFSDPDASDEIPLIHRDRAFDDAEAFNTDCKSELRTIGKAAIRATFGVMVAHPLGNRLLLEGRYPQDGLDPQSGQPISGTQIISATRANIMGAAFCLTGVDDVAAPPTAANEYRDKQCEGFEEYIATMAIESYRRNLGIFRAEDLPLIWRFWCVKVWKGCSGPNGEPPIGSEEEANTFVRASIDFIEWAKDQTDDVYNATVQLDNQTLGNLTQVQQMGAYPFLGDICAACVTINGSAVLSTTTRGDLRLCNLVSVDKKVNGKSADHSNALAYFEDGPVLIPDRAILGKLKAELGVKYAVYYPLQVRVQNASANEAFAVPLSIYEGDGLTRGDFNRRLTSVAIPYLPPGARSLIDVQTLPKKASTATATPPPQCAPIAQSNRESAEVDVPQRTTTNVDLFPALFAVEAFSATQQTDKAAAIAFVVDPDQEFSEPDKENNQAAFYYYLLDTGRANPPIPANLPARVPFVLSEFQSTALCLDHPAVDVEAGLKPLARTEEVAPQPRLTTRDAAVEPYLGDEDLRVAPYQPFQITYRVENSSPTDPIYNVRVERNGQRVFELAELAPGARYFHEETLSETRAGLQRFVTVATAEDAAGNLIGPDEENAQVTVANELSPVRLWLYDASELAAQDHPLSRWDVHHDPNNGEEIPIVGAVTDGAARVRIDAEGIAGDLPLRVSVEDWVRTGERRGVGYLEFKLQDGSVISGAELEIANPAQLNAGAQLLYVPPAQFIRTDPDLRLRDTFKNGRDGAPTLVRRVRIKLIQPGVGLGEREVQLMRPPVWYFHGFGGTPSVWDGFYPAVPFPGLNHDPAQYVRGFDGRFMLFAGGDLPTVAPVAAEASAYRSRIRAGMHNPDLKGFAISKFYVVGNSMGGLIGREIARQFVAQGLPAPVGKLITIGTPHLGSPLANRIIAIRDQAQLDPNGLWPDFLRRDPNDPIYADPALRASRDNVICATLIQLIGQNIPSLNSYSGAAEDLQVDSLAIQRLQAAGVLVPSHYIAGNIDISPEVIGDTPVLAEIAELGAGTEIQALWTGTGLLCNWTPAPATIPATQSLQTTVKYAASANLARGTLALLQKFTLYAAGKVLFQQLMLGLKVGQGAPEPILPDGGDDRIVPIKSQQGELTVTDSALTLLSDWTDHLDIKEMRSLGDRALDYTESWIGAETPALYDRFRELVPRCLTYLETAYNSPTRQPTRTLSEKEDVACQVIFLLEDDPASRLFFMDTDAAQARSQPITPAPRATSTVPSPLTSLPAPQVTAPQAELRILSPLAGAVVPAGSVIPVTVEISPALALSQTVFASGAQVLVLPDADLSTVISLPVAIIGPSAVAVTAQATDGRLLGDEVEITLAAPSPLRRLEIVVPARLTSIGQLEQVRVFGIYADGVRRDLTNPVAGTSYAVSNPSILGISADGQIQARRRGFAQVRVTVQDLLGGPSVFDTATVEVAIADDPGNTIPSADAGPDQSVAPERVVVLSAAASTDADGDPLSYQWTQVDGPFVWLMNPTSAEPYFISPLVESPTVLTFALTVTDSRGASALPTQVHVIVR